MVESGFFFEWDVVQRSMQDALEDVTFLVLGEEGKTKVYRRYLEFFFDADVDRDGELTERPNVRIERRDVRNVLSEELRQNSLNGVRRQSSLPVDDNYLCRFM